MNFIKSFGFLLCILGNYAEEGTTDNASTIIEQSNGESFEQQGTENPRNGQTVGIRNPEKLLFDHLLKDYERDARPVTTWLNESMISVNISITLKQIKLDVENHMLFSFVWISLEWVDHLLKWDPNDFYNLTDIRISIDRIWHADFGLYNSVDEDLSLTKGHTPAVINSNGRVSWIEPKHLRSFCHADVTYFPFDRHSCQLTIGSWSLDGDKVNLELKADEVELDETSYLGGWKILSTNMFRSKIYYFCCPEPYVDVKATFVMERKATHYVFNTILPCLLLSTLLIFTKLLSQQCGLRLRLEILVLFIFSLFLWNFTSILPPNSTSLLLIYLLLMISLTVLSILFTIWISNLYQAEAISSSDSPLLLKFMLAVCKDSVHETVNATTEQGDVTNNTKCINSNTEHPLTESDILQETETNTMSSVLCANCTKFAQTVVTFDNENMANYDKVDEKVLVFECKRFAQKLDKFGFYCFAILTVLVNICLLVISI